MNYSGVLKKIKPNAEEIIKSNKIAKDLINEINKEGYESILVGSSARNTFLKGANDLDIFVFFPKTVERERFEKMGVALGKKVLEKHRPRVHYAEHPYVKGIVDTIDIDIVPCYKIKEGEQIISAVDRSPLHNEYIGKKIKGMEDQVLLLKQFLKGNRCYGANEKVQGFSGALCEVLILQYKTFDKLIEDVANQWDKRIIINAKRTDVKRFSDQLIVIDPVDSNRNMAAAVSRRTLARFILKAREFLEDPSEERFFPKSERPHLRDIIKRKIVIVEFAYPKESIEEIVWSQLRKLCKLLKMKLEEEGFITLRDFCWTDEKRKCAILFEVEDFVLGRFKKRKGPEFFEKEHVKKFMEKYGKAWIERSRLFAWQERKYVKIKDFLDFLIKKETVPSAFKKVVPKSKIAMGRALIRHVDVLQAYVNELI